MHTRSCDKHSSRWLLPREHGAHAEVLFPLLTVFCLGKLTLASCALSLAILAGFLAHEPLQILLGARGGALQRELRGRARVQGALLLTLSSAAAALGLHLADPSVFAAAAGLLPALALVLGLTLTGRGKSLLGELLVALLLAFAAVPVALAAGLSARSALCSALAWSAVFIVGTTTVHALLARKKRGTLAPSFAVAGLGLVITSGALFSSVSGAGTWLLATVPMSFVAVAALLLGVPPKRLRALGWAMVLAHVGAAFALWLSLRNASLGVKASTMPTANSASHCTNAQIGADPCVGARPMPNWLEVGTEREPAPALLQRELSCGVGVCHSHAFAVQASLLRGHPAPRVGSAGIARFAACPAIARGLRGLARRRLRQAASFAHSADAGRAAAHGDDLQRGVSLGG